MCIRDRDIDFAMLRERYYETMGWNPETGKPLDSTLEELGIKELVGGLP